MNASLVFPPPRVLRSELLKRCTDSDLQMFRLDTVIYMSCNNQSVGEFDAELPTFLREVDEAIARRTRKTAAAPFRRS